MSETIYIFRNLLDKEQKKSFFLISILTILVNLIDMMGVLSIVPYIALLANRDLAFENVFFVNVFDFFKNFSFLYNYDPFLLLGVCLFLFIVFGQLLKAYTNFKQLFFVEVCECKLSERLFSRFLSNDYEWYVEKKSSDLGKNVLAEPSLVVAYFFTPLMVVVSQLPVLLVLSLTIVFLDPYVWIITVGFFGLIYGLVFSVSRKYLEKIGNERVTANSQRYQITSEAFRGFKSIKLLDLGPLYLSKFSFFAQRYASFQSKAQVISLLPRYLLEVLAFGGVLAVCLLMFSNDNELGLILPKLALIAIVGYRALPSLQQLYSAVVHLRFIKRPALDLVKELTSASRPETKKNNNPTGSLALDEITLDQVSFSYNNCEDQSLSNIRISIPNGTVLGVVGPTGSGKSTLIDVLIGLLEPTTGKVEVSTTTQSNSNCLMSTVEVGYVPQEVFLSDDTIERNIAFGVDSDDINHAQIEFVSKIACVDQFVATLPNRYQFVVGENGSRLSGGQKQRVGIARALYTNPAVLVLDEATSALDAKTAKEVMNGLNSIKENLTIVQVAHRLDAVRDADNIIVMYDGKIVAQGKYNELCNTSELFRSLVG